MLTVNVLPAGVLTAIILGVAGCSLYFLLKKRPLTKKGRIMPIIQEILKNPEQIRVNLHTIHTPSICGYPLKILNYLYYTALGKLLLSRTVLSRSNLDLFADRVILEPPTLKYSPPLPKGGADMNNRSIFVSLMRSNQYGKQWKSVSDFIVAYKSGKTTPLDIAHTILVAIENSNGGETPLRAIVTCNRMSVLSMAESSTERWRNGSPLSLLDGIPISIKEDIHTDAYACYCGATFVPEFVKGLSKSNVARKLSEAGAIIIGVTNMPEFGCNSIGSSENLLHKQPHNPCNTDFFPGGSSSGCAVSVASGLCPISVGGDGGGSGRVPAAVCGTYALKLTNGLLNETGSFASMFSFSVTSPICRSPLDIAILMDTLCNFNSDLEDTTELISSIRFNGNALSTVGATLSGVTIGVYWDWIEEADQETVSVFHNAVDELKLLGAVIKDVKIPELEKIRVAHIITTLTELSAIMAVDVDKHFYEIGPGPLMVSALGREFSAKESMNAMKQRTRTIIALEAVFNEVDFIATPTTGCPIPRITPEYYTTYGKIDGEAIGKLEMFTYLANFTGMPAITIPVGLLNKDLGLPVGLQLMAPWYQEPQLIKCAMCIEASGQFPELKPKVWYDLIPSC